MNDLTHSEVKIAPVIISIHFERPAARLPKGPVSLSKPRKKSRPPIKIIRPMSTIICISNFFLAGTLSAKKPSITNGAPRKLGINEVID